MGVGSHRMLVRTRAKRRRRALLPLAHHLGNGMSDDRSCLFNLFLGETGSDAHFQCGRDNLLRLEVVLEGLQPRNQNAVGQSLRILEIDLS